MRRGIIFVLIILLVLSLGIAVCACEGTPNEEDLQVLDWQDYLYRVAVAIDLQFLNVDTSKDVNCDFAIDVTDIDNGDKYACTLKLNLDLNSKDQQGVLKIDKVADGTTRAIVQIYNEDALYLQHYDEDTGEYTRTRFDNSPLIYTLIQLVGNFGENIDYSTIGGAFISLGKVFFTDATANAEHTEYIFDFDLKKGLQNTSVRDTFAKLPKIVQKMFFSLANVENYEDMLDKTPSLKGKIKVSVIDGKLSLSSDELTYKKGELTKKVAVEMPIISISNGRDESIEDSKPNGEEYGSGRLSDLTSIGVVKLQNTALNKVEMQYEYELRAKLDWIELLAEGGDLNKLADDNFFHIKISHKCNDNCTAFCKDKYDAAKGAILDIAFSPTDFGTHDIYISIGLRALIGARVTSQMFSMSESLVRTTIPEYWLSVISANTLTRQVNSKVDVPTQTDDNDSKIFLEELLVALIYDEDTISMPIEKTLQILGMSQNEISSVMSIFNCNEYQIDTLTLQQTYYRWNVSPYDIKRSAIHLYGNDVSGTKQYTKGFISRPPALTYQSESASVTDGKTTYEVVKLYNDDYEKGILYDSTTPMSLDEIDKLIGSYAHAKAQDIYGDIFDTQLYVAGHSQIDTQDNGWQRVELYCLPTGRGFIDGMLWESIREYEWSRWFCITLTTYIKFDELDNIEYLRSDKGYMQGEKLSSKDTPERITAVLSYAGGANKNIYVSAANKDQLLIVDSAGQRYIGADKSTMLQFYLFGKYYGSLVTITPAKSVELSTTAQELTLEYSDSGYSSQLRVGRLAFVLADDSVVQLTLPMDNIKINGYALKESNEYFYVNPTSYMGAIVIRNTGRYLLTFSYLNYEKSIPLYIQPKSESRDESKYQLDNITNINSHYFEGYTYAFSANISNSYHGEWGIDAIVNIQVLRGHITSSGTLSYTAVEGDELCFDISEISIDGTIVDNDHLLSLPPTIYGNMPIRTRVQFLKSGYYKVRIKLGTSVCEQELFVEEVFE